MRRLVLLAGVGAAVAALAAAAVVALVPSRPAPRPSPAAGASAAPVRAAWEAAAAALRAGDRAAFAAALPARSGSAAALLDDLYRSLAPLPWRSLWAVVDGPAGPGATGTGVADDGRGAGAVRRWRVRLVGGLEGAGPPDRVAAEVVVAMQVDDGVAVVADATPPALRRRDLLALHDPFVVRRPGLLVVGERRARARAVAVADAASLARARLARLGVAGRAPVVVLVFSSAEDARASLGVRADGARLAFFAFAAPRLAPSPWPRRDVGVNGPWLRDVGAGAVDYLAHELAHAYTAGWFDGRRARPALLVEGLAQAAEGVDWAPVREELASGNQLWPLPESFACEDLWQAGDDRLVTLGYEMGGALVTYVADRWGPAAVRDAVLALADAPPSRRGADRALRRALGVGWDDFMAGFRRDVAMRP